MLTPESALEATGRRKDWIARQMGISPSYLSRLLSGDRAWTERFRKAFSQAVGIGDEALLFGPNVGIADTESNSAGIAEDAPGEPPDAREAGAKACLPCVPIKEALA
jgi:transcriptional regulator with XRE-family HTH domain